MVEIKATEQEISVLLEEKRDYYSTVGCCLTCSSRHTGCLCFNCKCKICKWYETYKGLNKGGNCAYVGQNTEIETVKTPKNICPECGKEMMIINNNFKCFKCGVAVENE